MTVLYDRDFGDEDEERCEICGKRLALEGEDLCIPCLMEIEAELDALLEPES